VADCAATFSGAVVIEFAVTRNIKVQHCCQSF
jgi:hypothetical protein